MAEERIRLEIAFDAGQGMAVLVPPSTADELEQALATGVEDTFTFEAEDGSYTIALRRVVFVKRFSRESRVGFLNS